MKNRNLIIKIIELLKTIYDPELSLNIYDLGLIYDVHIIQQANIKIIMTLTTPNCPIADNFLKEIRQKLYPLNKDKRIDILLSFDPKWTFDMLSEEARLKLDLK